MITILIITAVFLIIYLIKFLNSTINVYTFLLCGFLSGFICAILLGTLMNPITKTIEMEKYYIHQEDNNKLILYMNKGERIIFLLEYNDYIKINSVDITSYNIIYKYTDIDKPILRIVKKDLSNDMINYFCIFIKDIKKVYYVIEIPKNTKVLFDKI